jgi:hypothetical protein
MGAATGFLWLVVVILAAMWALNATGTVRIGVDLAMWLNILLIVAFIGALFNMFVVPFLGRTRTTTSSASGSGASARPTADSRPVAGASHQQEVVEETRDRPSF